MSPAAPPAPSPKKRAPAEPCLACAAGMCDCECDPIMGALGMYFRETKINAQRSTPELDEAA